MKHIITLGDLPQDRKNAWLVGAPGSGDSCSVRHLEYDRAAMPALRQSPVDRTLFVLSGELSVRIGSETFQAEQDTLIFLPAHTPHAENSATDRTTVLEIFAPAPDGQPFVAAAERRIDNASSMVRPLSKESFSKGGFAYQALSGRDSGSNQLRVNMVEVQPGSGSPDYHIHAFDQFYFILSGEMQIDLGRASYVAGASNLVYLPAGVVHRNYNVGPGVERHLTLIVPEPQDGEIFDYACDIHEHEAEFMSSAPGWPKT